jgi:hypothetical protein
MTEGVKPAGTYHLKDVVIRSEYSDMKEASILDQVAYWRVEESMGTSFMTGMAKVIDGVGLIYKFPLRGEEIIEFTYEDWYKEERTDRFFIYAISNVKRAKDRGDNSLLEYQIHFVSMEKFFTDATLIQEGFKGYIDEYAQRVFDQHFAPIQGKTLELENGFTGNQVLAIPKLTPDQTMHFLTRRAYSEEYLSQSVRFFENRLGFYFASNEYVMNFGFDFPIPSNRRFYYGMANKKTPDTQELIMLNIIDFQMTEAEYVNTQKDMNYNPYLAIGLEADYLNRELIETPQYDYWNESLNFDTPAKFEDDPSVPPYRIRPRRSEQFVRQNFSRPREYLIYKDYADNDSPARESILPNKYFDEILKAKNSYFYSWDKNSVTCKIYGRNNLFAGNLVSVDITKTKILEPGDEIDREHSGYYMVERVVNEFDRDVYFQTLTLSRGGIAV